MSRLVISGGKRLGGAYAPGGNKNAVLPMLAAAVLTDEPVVLHNVPLIQDVMTMLEILEHLGVSANLLRTWREKLGQKGEEAFPGKGRLTTTDEELRKLRDENRRLRMERDILKKATAFFAKESS